MPCKVEGTLLSMLSLDQKIMGRWSLSQGYHTENQSLFWTVPEGSSSTSGWVSDRVQSSAQWKEEPSINESFPTMMSFLWEILFTGAKEKKTFLHKKEFGLYHFSCPPPPPPNHSLFMEACLVLWESPLFLWHKETPHSLFHYSSSKVSREQVVPWE